MQPKPMNPYQALTPINDPEMFFGPESLMGRIYSALKHKQNVSLYGPQRAGKTTLLRCMSQPDIQERLGYNLDRHIFVYEDIRNWLSRSREVFFETISAAIIAASREHFDLKLPSSTGAFRFMEVLEQVHAQGFHTVLQLDAFDRITLNPAFDLEFFAVLRAQTSKPLVSYVTASVRPLDELVHSAIRTSPFFNIFAFYKMEPLTADEAYKLIMILSRRAGCPFTEAEAAWVLKLSGGMPFFLQRVCYYLFEEKCQAAGAEVEKKRVARQAYNDLLPHFNYLWEALDEKKKEQLKEEAQRKGLVRRDLPEYSESSLFRKFVRETCHLSFVHLHEEEVLEALREALKHLDKPGMLGASKLRHLKLVLANLKENDVALTFKTGLAVREVLNRAFEQMKGPGSRVDLNQAWRSYNVLYYTYFEKKSSMNQKQIAARVGVSERHYHRVKDAAIETLGTILLEMEEACEKDEED